MKTVKQINKEFVDWTKQFLPASTTKGVWVEAPVEGKKNKRQSTGKPRDSWNSQKEILQDLLTDYGRAVYHHDNESDEELEIESEILAFVRANLMGQRSQLLKSLKEELEKEIIIFPNVLQADWDYSHNQTIEKVIKLLDKYETKS